MSCTQYRMCDVCDLSCANYYKETENYIATCSQILMPDGTYKCCKIVRYKFPKYDERNGKQILFEIIIPDDKETKE